MLHIFDTYVASVLSGCYMQWVFMYFQVFLQVFQTHVSRVLSDYRHIYVANVLSRCFKSSSGVAHVALYTELKLQHTQPEDNSWLASM